MNKKELIIELMKIDKFLEDKSEKLSNILNAEGCCLLGDTNEDIKGISDIIFDFVNIPGENFDFNNNDFVPNNFVPEEKTYCRDGVFSLYFDGVFEEKISLEKLAEILIEIGKNEGEFNEKHIKLTKEKLDWNWM